MTSPSSPGRTRVPHLLFLDGLRGLSAIYVVTYHCWQYLPPHAMPQWLTMLAALFEQGHSAVCIFIVLSGYALMLPILFSQDGKTIPNGIANFMQRRVRRIFPAYYSALILFTGIGFINPSLPSEADFARLTVAGIVSHIFLIHNLSRATINQIDSPMWSLATEWQIYFVFAMLLIPLSRRIGLGWTLLATGLLSLLPHFFLNPSHNFDQACPWFLILFQFGMIAAYCSYGNQKEVSDLRQKLPWGWFAVATYGIWLLLTYQHLVVRLVPILRRMHVGDRGSWIFDIVCGAAVAFLLVDLSRCLQTDRTEGKGRGTDHIASILQSRFAVWLGAFSYSLYLVHYPIIQSVVQLLRMKRLHLPNSVIWVLLPLIAIPVSVAFSYLFYLFFERPFLRSRTASMKPQ